MSRRRVGGVIKKGRGAKIALREEDDEEEEVDEDAKDTKKAKALSKLSRLQTREEKLMSNRNRFWSTSKMKIRQDTSKNSAKNSNHQPANNALTEILTEFVFVRPVGTRTISP